MDFCWGTLSVCGAFWNCCFHFLSLILLTFNFEMVLYYLFLFLMLFLPSLRTSTANSVCVHHSLLHNLWLCPSWAVLTIVMWLSHSEVRMELCNDSVRHFGFRVVNKSLWFALEMWEMYCGMKKQWYTCKQCLSSTSGPNFHHFLWRLEIKISHKLLLLSNRYMHRALKI